MICLYFPLVGFGIQLTMPVFGPLNLHGMRNMVACHHHHHHHLCREPHKPKDNPPRNPVKYRHRLFLFLLQHSSSCPRSAVLCGTHGNIKPCRERFLVGSGIHCLPTTTTTTTARTSKNPNEMSASETDDPTSGSEEQKKGRENDPNQPTNPAQPSPTQPRYPSPPSGQQHDSAPTFLPSNDTSPQDSTGRQSGSRPGALVSQLVGAAVLDPGGVSP